MIILSGHQTESLIWISRYDKMGNGSFRMNQPKYLQQRDMEILIPLKSVWVRHLSMQNTVYSSGWRCEQRSSPKRKGYSNLTEDCQVWFYSWQMDKLEKKVAKKKDFFIFRGVRFWNSLPVEAVETKHKLQKWIVQCMLLTLTHEILDCLLVIALCPIVIAMKWSAY